MRGGTMPCSRKTAPAPPRDRAGVLSGIKEPAKPFLSDEHFTVDGTLIQT